MKEVKKHLQGWACFSGNFPSSLLKTGTVDQVKDHAKQNYACDFVKQYAALFAVACIFVVTEIASQQIVLINVTTDASLGRRAEVWKGPGRAETPAG